MRPVPVLLYHGVAPDAPEGLEPWVMHPERFAAHLDHLVERGVHALTVSELADAVQAGRPLPDDTVAITFDDGLADFAEHAWPALRSRDLAATLYVVSGNVGGRADWLAEQARPPRMVTWEQLRQLDAEGCEIGGHSVTHPELDTLRRQELVEEVGQCRRDLSAGLGHPVRSFAYPHGYHDQRVRAAVVAAGYDSACAVREALSSTADDPFARARVTLRADATVADLAAVLDGRGLRVAPFAEPVRTKAWRTVRRRARRPSARRLVERVLDRAPVVVA